ncbi:hypothetical protein [Candidatus Synchoanobacter obligatus]|uniref:Uncharacterized protein n=1 Tax=Candidatus Synchoanobacter obligatus TaxID=2919597 RepID=A0ABT1L3W8_9GAMM|nr:hypothetical protein [Candidatus Synchoanobacter obligatus]MCP8351878.1 hypothetical protein [Candidatus Synchoanobacter obligatus]
MKDPKVETFIEKGLYDLAGAVTAKRLKEAFRLGESSNRANKIDAFLIPLKSDINFNEKVIVCQQLARAYELANVYKDEGLKGEIANAITVNFGPKAPAPEEILGKLQDVVKTSAKVFNNLEGYAFVASVFFPPAGALPAAQAVGVPIAKAMVKSIASVIE